MKVAIFASGTGTNFWVLAQAFNQGKIPGKLALLVCDHPDAPVIAKACQLGVKTFCLTVKQAGSKRAFEEQIAQKLHQEQIDFIALAGYMRVVGSPILDDYEGKIINLHPAYLPEYQGLHAIERAFFDHQHHGKNYTGVTLHYIDAGLDTGPIIAQQKVSILPDDTLETLEQRIHHVEHQMYPQVLAEQLAKLQK